MVKTWSGESACRVYWEDVLSAAVRGSILSASLIWSVVLFQFSVFWLSLAYFFFSLRKVLGYWNVLLWRYYYLCLQFHLFYVFKCCDVWYICIYNHCIFLLKDFILLYFTILTSCFWCSLFSFSNVTVDCGCPWSPVAPTGWNDFFLTWLWSLLISCDSHCVE